jgi:succinate-semialdehyde dehydrogenase / glutarate-semialdehyde dehydrogenase
MIASISPATGELLRRFAPLSDAEVDRKIERAAEAFARYRRLPRSTRASRLAQAGANLEKEKERYARLMTLEMGKLFREAMAEVTKCAWACSYYAEHAEQFLADERVDTGASKSSICYQPLGPLLAIMPWNFPFWQVFRFAAPALMAGNVVLLKHASNVPQCALAIEAILQQAGFPEGVFQTLFMETEKVDRVLADPRIVAATLTGSEFAGIEVGVAAAKRIKKVVLELGGSDPFIVMPSANLEQAIETAVQARIQNNGQSCIAAKRFIIAEPVADQFEHEFVRRMATLTLGDPFEPNTQLGPLATAAGMVSLDGQVRKTVEQGARLLTGGRSLNQPGNFYTPTVLTHIPQGSPGDREELFGPVACLFRVRDTSDAIRIANQSPFGLGASAWTNDENERQRFVDDLETGMLFVNRMVASDPRLPFGGVKRSGYGRELGIHGIREFTNIKTVWIEGS